jgi:hypothetical protein
MLIFNLHSGLPQGGPFLFYEKGFNAAQSDADKVSPNRRSGQDAAMENSGWYK